MPALLGDRCRMRRGANQCSKGLRQLLSQKPCRQQRKLSTSETSPGVAWWRYGGRGPGSGALGRKLSMRSLLLETVVRGETMNLGPLCRAANASRQHALLVPHGDCISLWDAWRASKGRRRNGKHAYGHEPRISRFPEPESPYQSYGVRPAAISLPSRGGAAPGLVL